MTERKDIKGHELLCFARQTFWQGFVVISFVFVVWMYKKRNPVHFFFFFVFTSHLHLSLLFFVLLHISIAPLRFLQAPYPFASSPSQPSTRMKIYFSIAALVLAVASVVTAAPAVVPGRAPSSNSTSSTEKNDNATPAPPEIVKILKQMGWLSSN